LYTASEKLSPQGIHVEFDIMPHQHLGLLQGLLKKVESLIKGNSFGSCFFSGDSMHLFGRIGNLKTVGTDQYIVVAGEFPVFVVQLPGNLHNPWPVIYLTNRCIVPFGEACSLCVKYQKHER